MSMLIRLLSVGLPALLIFASALGVNGAGPAAVLLLALQALAPRPAIEGGADGRWLLWATALAMPLVLAATLAALVLPQGTGLVARGLTALAGVWWLGQTGFSCAHELIHGRLRAERRLGAALFAMLGWGHHASAHLLVHHVHVATARDPNTARLGESLWRFLPRAALGSVKAAWVAEHRRGGLYACRTFVGYALITGGTLALATVAFGAEGALAWLGISLVAVFQLMAVDYVQHYGLRRCVVGARMEPVGPAHAWDAPGGLSDALLFNAGRHADHHARPGASFEALAQRRGAPRLPAPLAAMVLLATVPPFWRDVMDRRALAHRATPPSHAPRSVAAERSCACCTSPSSSPPSPPATRPHRRRRKPAPSVA
ncbi:MAG: alkane 1-monooxygenase [Shimia sp.]